MYVLVCSHICQRKPSVTCDLHLQFDCCGVNAESFNTRLDQQEYMDCTDPILADCSSTRNTNATTLRWVCPSSPSLLPSLPHPLPPSFLMQGCLVYLTQEIQGDLYDLGAIGMAFGTFEVHLLHTLSALEGTPRAVNWANSSHDRNNFNPL